MSHWTDIQNSCSCKNSQIPVMALLQWYCAFSWEDAWSLSKIGFFNLQGDLWALHGSRAALNLQSEVNCFLLPIPVHWSCSPLRRLLMPCYCLSSSAVRQKIAHQYSEPHSFSLRSFAWILCWSGRKAGANWKNSIPYTLWVQLTTTDRKFIGIIN